MEWRKIVLYVISAVFGALLVFSWQKEHRQHPQTVSNSNQAGLAVNNEYVPQSKESSNNPSPQTVLTDSTNQPSLPSNLNNSNSNSLIRVKTDVLDVSIDPKGGNLVDARLLKYPVDVNDPNVPTQILNSDPSQLYLSQSGIITPNKSEVISYQSKQPNYFLSQEGNNLDVVLTGKSENGLDVTKTYTFERGKYAIDLNYQVTNNASKATPVNFYQQITRGGFPVKSSLHGRSYTGPSISSHETPFEKIPFKKLSSVNISRDVIGGWLAMQQQYFLSAWVPNQSQTNHFYSNVFIPSNSRSYTDNIYTIGYLSPSQVVNPGKNINYHSVFYVGPELPDHLKLLAPNLDRTIDYGWLWFISEFIFWLMKQIHHVVGNWGWSIVLVTLLARASLYWFAAKGFRSMAKMREVQPRIQALKERFGEDRQALSKATMEFYRKEKINPMGGCLPMIIQIPVFFALYYVLIESVQLRQAPFILWVKDLSVHDPYYVLPILMGLSMLLQQKISPPLPDQTQAKMMMLLPLVFTVFFLSFPAGLVLYWLTNNLANVAQQWYIMRTYNPKEVRDKERQKEKKKQKKKIKL